MIAVRRIHSTVRGFGHTLMAASAPEHTQQASRLGLSPAPGRIGRSNSDTRYERAMTEPPMTTPTDTRDIPFREINGKPIRWTDKSGVTHICEGSNVHPDGRLIWTLCERDVPANSAWLLGPRSAHEICIICKKRADLPAGKTRP